MRWRHDVLALCSCLVPITGSTAIACGDKRLCKEMATCAEAVYYLAVCGVGRLDADNDTIPCETVCGKSVAVMQSRLVAQPFKLTAPDIAKADAKPAEVLQAVTADALTPQAYSCGAKQTCKQMVSREEATFHLKHCGVGALDGNGDGVACNSLCRVGTGQ